MNYSVPHSNSNHTNFCTRSNSVKTSLFLGFLIEQLPEHEAELLFEALVETSIITQELADYIKSVCSFKLPSEQENILIKKVQAAIASKDFEAAIKFAHEIHALSLAEDQERLGGSLYRDGNGNRLGIDCSRAALDLAEALEPVSPELALKALKIFEEYNIKDIASPYIEEALEKASQISMSLCGSSSDETVNRKHREEAMKRLLIQSGENPTAFIEFFKLLELHCGNNPFDVKTLLFKDIKISSGEEMIEGVTGMIFKMANYIYNAKNEIETLKSAVKEEGSKAGKESTKLKDTKSKSAKEAEMHDSRSALILSKKPSVSKASASLGGLDEDEDEEVSVAPDVDLKAGGLSKRKFA